MFNKGNHFYVSYFHRIKVRINVFGNWSWRTEYEGAREIDNTEDRGLLYTYPTRVQSLDPILVPWVPPGVIPDEEAGVNPCLSTFYSNSKFDYTLFLFCSVVLRVFSWVNTQGLHLTGSGAIWGAGDRTCACHIQSKYPTCCIIITPAPCVWAGQAMKGFLFSLYSV